MDLTTTIAELRREKERLERVIASLQELQVGGTMAAFQKKRRGRKSMSPEERRTYLEAINASWIAIVQKKEQLAALMSDSDETEIQ